MYDLFWRLFVWGGSQNKGYIKNQYLCQLIEEYIDTWSEHARGEGPHYIPRLRVTDEYSGIYSSALYSSVASSVKRGI
jgi:hypothetical protein